MTERVRALLDEAVSGLEPRDPDPVARVVARGRAARRRTIGAAAVMAVAVLVGGGFAVSAQSRPGPAPLPPLRPEEAASPPIPKQVGNAVVAGDVTVPVPDGWRVVTASDKPPCGELDKTVLIAGPDMTGCQTAPIEVRGTQRRFPMGMLNAARSAVWPDAIVTSPKAYTLRGGGPAWLGIDVGDDSQNAAGKIPGYSFYNLLLIPWSSVVITFRVPGLEQRRIIDTIRTDPPSRTAGLAVPDTVVSATLTMPDAHTAAGFGKLTDQAKIAAVLDLLGTRTTAVDNAQACANPAQPTARLSLATNDFTMFSRPPLPSSAPANQDLDPPPVTVIISLGGGCQEAVSSDGGRVRLSDKTFDDLARLFGITAR